jgi:hypothetical protein
MFIDPPPIESAADVSTGSRTKVELTVLISSLMEGDSDALPGGESDLTRAEAVLLCDWG